VDSSTESRAPTPPPGARLRSALCARAFCLPLCALALALVLPGCRLLRGDNPGPAIEAQNPAVQRATLALPASALGTGDVIEVRVFQEADVSGVFRVAPEGSIDFPLCGKVAVGGLTAAAAADAIAQCLKAGRFYKSPQVSVFLKELNSRKVYVFGEVARPGTFPYEDGMSAVQAIALAGGFTRLASKNACTVSRQLAGEQARIKVPIDDIVAGRAPPFTLLPGDILFVPESLF
jgi:protein involved in polysaccharide export with SLBB domain